MTHDPALEAHEHAEHAEHAAHEHDPFINRVSITVAILAVMAASVSSLETVESGRAITSASEAVLSQDRATDSWNEYQSDSLKRHLYGLFADEGGPRAAKYAATAKDQTAKQGDIRKRAEEQEADRDRLMAESRMHEHRHHWLTAAATMVEIGIAICTVAIITRRRHFWLGSILLAVVGVGLFAAAYLT
jgi:hypothetical protein